MAVHNQQGLTWHKTSINYIYIIIIIIMSCHRHSYPWPFHTTSLNRSSLPVGPQGYTPYPLRAAVCRFELVTLLLLSHVKGFTGVHHLWAHLYFSSSVLHFWFIFICLSVFYIKQAFLIFNKFLSSLLYNLTSLIILSLN